MSLTKGQNHPETKYDRDRDKITPRRGQNNSEIYPQTGKKISPRQGQNNSETKCHQDRDKITRKQNITETGTE